MQCTKQEKLVDVRCERDHYAVNNNNGVDHQHNNNCRRHTHTTTRRRSWWTVCTAYIIINFIFTFRGYESSHEQALWNMMHERVMLVMQSNIWLAYISQRAMSMVTLIDLWNASNASWAHRRSWFLVCHLLECGSPFSKHGFFECRQSRNAREIQIKRNRPVSNNNHNDVQNSSKQNGMQEKQ